MNFETLLYDVEDGVATITLNRPDSLNALNRELSGGLREALAELRDDPEVVLGVLTGAGGRAFSAGMDLKERASLDAEGDRPTANSRGGGDGLRGGKVTVMCSVSLSLATVRPRYCG